METRERKATLRGVVAKLRYSVLVILEAQATSVWGLKLLVFETLSYYCVRP
jgi:hypothetical protein